MFITGLGTAAPPHRYTQAECWGAIQASSQFPRLSLRSRAILKKVLTGHNGIATRHFVLEKLDHAFDLTPDALHARFSKNAPPLATLAAERALTDAHIAPAEIDAVIISACTGYLCPGLTSYVSEQLGLRSDVFTIDMVGQGCGAALPNLRAGEALLAANRAKKVLSICVEVCSAAFYLDEDAGVLISACLFGDGAAAAVLSDSPNAKHRVQWMGGTSLLAPQDRELLRFEQKCGMLRNILKPEVPALAAKHAGKVLNDTLAFTGTDRSQVNGWMLHPGGRDVLIALSRQLNLLDDELRWSQSVLSEYGNMSSPSVLFVLQSALNGGAARGLWWMSSFGAGFSCHGALLDVR
jgi:predicted naringenin-chalcone synthase